MDSVLAELPLAVSTTLAPAASGAFIALALAFFNCTFTTEELKRIDKATLLPLALFILGLLASFFRFGDVPNAQLASEYLGSSLTDSEIAIGAIFGGAAIVYWILAFIQRLTSEVRQIFSGIIAIIGLEFSFLVGIGNSQYTMAFWGTSYSLVEVIGYMLLGGALLGAFVLSLARTLEEAKKTSFRKIAFIAALIGLLASVLALCLQVYNAGGTHAGASLFGSLTLEVLPYLIAGIILLVAAFVLGCLAIMRRRGEGTALLVVSVVLMFVGVFLCRIVFFAMELSVGA